MEAEVGSGFRKRVDSIFFIRAISAIRGSIFFLCGSKRRMAWPTFRILPSGYCPQPEDVGPRMTLMTRMGKSDETNAMHPIQSLGSSFVGGC
jgi:hypothetical protein